MEVDVAKKRRKAARPSARYHDAVGTPTKTVGYAYVGRWHGGDIGWGLPDGVSGDKRSAEPFGDFLRSGHWDPKVDKVELCRITVEVVPNARRRRVPKKEAA